MSAGSPRCTQSSVAVVRLSLATEHHESPVHLLALIAKSFSAERHESPVGADEERGVAVGDRGAVAEGV